MAIFSVYDYDRRVFEYFETPGAHQALGTAKFSSFRKQKRMTGENNIGAIPESVATSLPSGAKKVGEGDTPKGVIAEKGAPGGGFPVGKWAAYTFVGIITWAAIKGKI